MKEVDVALTDFLLTVQCWILAVLIALHHSNFEASIVTGLLFFAGLSALFGGVMHGFSHRMERPTAESIWKLSLLSVVVMSGLMWVLSGEILQMPVFFSAISVIQFLALGGVVLWYPKFLVAIISYLPALMVFLISFVLQWSGGEPGSGWVCLGLLISLVAPVFHIFKIGLHPRFLTFNSVYHLVQFVAFFYMYWGFELWL